MPGVSVLLPCYNAATTLGEALESLASQTLADFEIVAVDDGSSDATPDILQAWAARDSRMHVLRQPHSGIIAALNAGLGACSATLVARMDADDRSHPQRLERQAAFLEAHPEIDVVSCQVAGFPAEGVRQGFAVYIDWLNALLSDADMRREMFVESPLPHPSVAFRKQAVLEAGGYQEQGWAEDYDLWLRLYLAGRHFAKLPEVLLDWREHPERLTRVDSRYSLENFLRCKAFYLTRGPLAERDAVIIWGAGMVGRRLGKQLARQGARLRAFIDIDPRKIGRTRRGLPILPPEELTEWWGRYSHPALLAAVGARGARALIRGRLEALGLREGLDWWSVA
jgi:glycosyltransferase involved in cell wall biosynthesis